MGGRGEGRAFNLGAANLDINIIISNNFLDSFPFAFIETNNGMADIIESIAHTFSYTQNLVLYDKKKGVLHACNSFLCNK